ncbi:hypothetical protein MFIFM68171_09676 [Madurella fahalii]|uniref:Uncharacterized protein n=1 Tax=Madurella fahalii TaxID=1157608 RepID=A0ABQ0GP09_9PEZI
MPTSPWLEDAFESAREEFVRGLKNPSKYNFSEFNTIKEVYDAADAIQKRQAQTKTLRGVKEYRAVY